MFKIILLIALISLSACIKTADQVNREKRFDSISDQVKDSQGLVADLLAQMKDIQSQLNNLNGKIEEIEHRQNQVDPAKLNKMSETMNLIKTQQETESGQLQQIQNELKEQRTFMEKVTSSLTSIKATEKKKNAKEDMIVGLDLIKKDKYAQARKKLEAIIDHKDLTPGDNNKVLYGLGKVEYYTGNNDKGLVYFSKIYTKYPKSSLAPSSLLFIGRSLKKLGKNEEAKQAFDKVIEDYQGTKEANEAKKEL